MSTNTPSGDGPARRPLAKSERRQWIRYPTSVPVTVRPFGARDDCTWTGELRDVSFVGAGLVSENAVDVGAVLEVRPISRAWTAALKMTVRVRKTEVMPNGGWLLGCTFVRQLSEEEVQKLL